MDVAVLLLVLLVAALVGYIVGAGVSKAAAGGQRPSPVELTSHTSAAAQRQAGLVRPTPRPRTNTGAAPLTPSVSPLDALPLVPTTPHEKAFVHALATPPPLSRVPSPIPTDAADPHAAAAAVALPTWPPAPVPQGPPSTDSTPSSSRRGSDISSSSATGVSNSTGGSVSRKHRVSKRVVIVAKQLPLITKKDAEGKWSVEWEDNRSFLSGLRSLRSRGLDLKWVGVPNTSGAVLSKDEQDDYEELMMEHDCVPVFLRPELADKFFNQFCKGVLWPMLHYVLPQSNSQFSVKWDEMWQAYTAANSLFASVVSHCVDTATDTIFIHNYHLLLLPSFLRTKLPRAKIGLFIHTPFPSSDVFRVLPTRQNILSSIMAADLLGFHTFDYARHFLSCTKRVMDLDFETLAGGSLGIKYNGRFVSILISHVGLDSDLFLQETRLPVVRNLTSVLRAKYGTRKIVVSASDLDAVKGGLLKFQAYHRFLQQNPEWVSRMVFVEMLLPNKSMTLDHSQDMGTLLRKQVDAIHAEFGKECFELIELPCTGMPLHDTVAYYAVSDVCVVSQFWDGLNLQPFEYTASQDPENPGALVISEFMGCSRTLNGVIRVNPWSLDSVSGAILQALGLSLEERKANHARRYNYVLNHSIDRWGATFLEHLDRASKLGEGMNYVQVGWGSNVKLMGLRSDFTHLDEEAVTATYRKAERRVLLLDYDGTLTPSEKTATRSKLVGPTPTVKRLLLSLSADPDNIVFIMSGRTRSTLGEWFPADKFPNLGLAAEKGLFLRWPERLSQHCRQDLRHDPALRKRVADRKTEREAARQAEMAEKANLTSESRSAAFVEQQTKAVAAAAAEAAADASASPVSPVAVLPPSASSSALSARLGGGGGDAHLLLEEVLAPVDDSEWEYMIALEDISWKQTALEIIRSYTEQTDGSWIEDKEFAVVWHYEQADPEYGRLQASELSKYIVKVLGNPAVDVVRYDYQRILEVKPHGISKGLAATAIMEELYRLSKERSKLCTRPGSPSSTSPTAVGGLGLIQENDSQEAAASVPTTLYARSSSDIGPPLSPMERARSSVPVLSSAAAAAAAAAGVSASMPPFVFCVGDDRSDEDMFLSVQNKDYLEGKLRQQAAALLGGNALLPASEQALKRSMSAAPPGHHSRTTSTTRNNASGVGAGGEVDEKTARERRKNRIADPLTFTVCVGMKPSNAHYFLHDDEEVVRLLHAFSLASQRIAHTRDMDARALSMAAQMRQQHQQQQQQQSVANAAGSGAGAAASRPASVANLTVMPPRNPGILRPTDIPTTPPVPLGVVTGGGGGLPMAYAVLGGGNGGGGSVIDGVQRSPLSSLSGTAPLRSQHQQQPQFSANYRRPRAASMSASENDEEDDDDGADEDEEDEDEEDDSDAEMFAAKRAAARSSGKLTAGGGLLSGLRRM